MDKLLYFSNGSTDFYEILHADAEMETALNVKCDISAAVRPISMKFGTMMHLSP